jgi:hypothetical protein
MIIKLGQHKYSYSQPRLRKWIELEEIKSNLASAAVAGKHDTVSEKILAYVSAALCINPKKLDAYPWYSVATVFVQLSVLSIPSRIFPILSVIKDDKKAKNDFDYVGRDWYFWLHKLSAEYGWLIVYIENMKIDDAVGLMQEILYNEQVKREWDWGTTEMAYSYNENTKKSTFNELERPGWMRSTTPIAQKELVVEKVPMNMIPVGNVVRIKVEAPKPNTSV